MNSKSISKIEIQKRISDAKTVEELLSIATLAGETLSPKQAQKLFQEIEAERERAKKNVATDDLSDEELEKVAGGLAGEDINGKKYAATELTFRDGDNVMISFSSTSYYCKECRCIQCGCTEVAAGSHWTKCKQCEAPLNCECCAFRKEIGNIFYRDHCLNTKVRAMHGLPPIQG